MSDTAQGDDPRWMSLALRLGRRGQGKVWPNPAVGCVLVQDGRVVGRGWTQPGGRPHAETQALAQAGDRARGATAYVSLEPCAHHGKTPPCADRLVDAGVRRVVSALEDPDPRVSGLGHARLRAAGVEVVTGVMQDAARRDHAGFLLRVIEGRPLVTLKLAMSLDGRIATSGGESQWITGPQARRLGHALRGCNDAVLVGAGTARADDPTLTLRGFGQVRQPVRIVASRALDLAGQSRLTASVSEAPLWLLHGAEARAARRDAFEQAGAKLIEVPAGAQGLCLPSALRQLASAGLTRIYCEGGGRLAANMLKANLVDRIIVFTAGLALGSDGLPGVGPLALERLGSARRFALEGEQRVGADLVAFWTRID